MMIIAISVYIFDLIISKKNYRRMGKCPSNHDVVFWSSSNTVWYFVCNAQHIKLFTQTSKACILNGKIEDSSKIFRFLSLVDHFPLTSNLGSFKTSQMYFLFMSVTPFILVSFVIFQHFAASNNATVSELFIASKRKPS